MSDPWSLVETQFSLDTAKAYEGLFTQGSGYLQLRGSLEEHLANAPQNVAYTRIVTNVTAEKFQRTPAKWGTYVPGTFGPHPTVNTEMINLPFFLDLCPTIDGEILDMGASKISEYRRELTMRNAVLTRTLLWQTRSGARVRVKFERFLSAARPNLCVQRMELASDRAVTLDVAAGIDADVLTNGFDHFRAVQVAPVGAAGVACQLQTNGDDQVQIESQLLLKAPWRYAAETRRGRLTATVPLTANQPLVVEKRTAVTTSRDLQPGDPAGHLQAALALSFDQLLQEHAQVWATRWQNADVVIDGDPEAQLAIRSSIYHLLRVHVPDPRVAVDAKGYAGEAYFGRFFWDTEVCLLPFYLYTNPAAARTLVDFRIQALPGARQNAAGYGYPGARYPWESNHLGQDGCPCWQYKDHEIHVTADVVYGLAHYAAATQQPEYLTGPAAEVIVEAARYWMARMDWRPGEDHPSLLGVMGPDEYTPISSNNAYTNRLVKFTLKLASELGARAGATPQECAAFADAAAKLPIRRSADGELVLQCEEFPHLADPQFDRLWRDRRQQFAAQTSQERIYRSKCLKQADVLMLMMLFPQDFTAKEVRRAWDYYLPYTTHDSSLSAGAHAVMACRLGLRDEAWRFWNMSANIDLDIPHGGAAEGIHIAGAGNNWQIIVQGFAGLASAMSAQDLTLRPQLPAAWSRLAFPLVWHGCPAYVEIVPGKCTVTNRGTQSLRASVGGQTQTLAAGQAAVFPLA